MHGIDDNAHGTASARDSWLPTESAAVKSVPAHSSYDSGTNGKSEGGLGIEKQEYRENERERERKRERERERER